MAIKLEQYADTLVRIARMQQKLQSYHLLPIALEQEMLERQAGKLSEKTIRYVDQLRSASAQPNEIAALTNDLRALQKDIKNFEKTQSLSPTGRIRLLNERLFIADKLEVATSTGEKLKRDLHKLQPGGIKSLLSQLFKRKEILELKANILRNEKEVSMLRLASPRPRQVKSMKKAIQSTFAEKSERELKSDIREMKSELSLFYRAERDRAMMKHYQGLANTTGIARVKLSFQHLREYMKGYGVTQRDKQVEEARSVRLANSDQVPKNYSLWQAILRPNEIYQQQVDYLKDRLSVYEKKVPSKQQIERLEREISQWSKELEIRQMHRAQGKPIQPARPVKENGFSNETEMQQTERPNLYTIERSKSLLIRVEQHEMEILRSIDIPFVVPENQVDSYEILEGDKTVQRQYSGVQIEVSSLWLPTIEKALGRSFATDPEVGTIKYSVLKREQGKKVLMENVSSEKISMLMQYQAPFAAFKKGESYNVICRKSDVGLMKSIMNSAPLEPTQQKALSYQMSR